MSFVSAGFLRGAGPSSHCSGSDQTRFPQLNQQQFEANLHRFSNPPMRPVSESLGKSRVPRQKLG
jgi:hypothetical protein